MVVANEQMEKIMSNMMNMCGSMNQVATNSMNAMAESVTAFTKGYEEMVSAVSNMMRTYVETSVATSRTILSAKSLKDAVDAQTNAIKTQSELMMSEVNKLSALSSRIAQETITPVTNQVSSVISQATNIARAA